MKLITLTKNQYALVDDQDYERVSQYHWYFNSGYAKAYYKGKRIRMHRLILGTPKGLATDHINGNKLDNRRENLRVATTGQNNCNVGLAKNNTSGYRGIYREPSTGHWRPFITIRGKMIHFGSFKEKRHAALARDLWALDAYGEFAFTNFNVVCSGLKSDVVPSVNLQ